MAKKATKAHKRHTEEARLAEVVRKMDKWMEAVNRQPEDALDEFEALATPPDSQEKTDLLYAVRLVRHNIAEGAPRWAAYWGIRAGVFAHSLGWSEGDAEQGLKVREARESARNKEKERQPGFQTVLDLVRKEEPDLLKTAAKEEAARRCKVSYRTIHRHTKW